LKLLQDFYYIDTCAYLFQHVMLQKYIQMNTAAVIFLGNSFSTQNHNHFMKWQSNKELVHENNYFGTNEIAFYITLKFKYIF